MTVTLDIPVDSARIAATQRISFSRTVDRGLIHHRSVSEVFVTDLVDFDEETFVAGAQLPRSHPYFLDPAARYGALLLGECSRQACTYLAHTRYAVPVGHAFLAVRTDFRLYDGPAPHDFFDGVVLSHEVGFRKPAPEVFAHAGTVARETTVTAVANHSFGFGGQNAVLVLTRC